MTRILSLVGLGRLISSAPAFNRASPERPRISTPGPFLLAFAESGQAARGAVLLNWCTSFQVKAHGHDGAINAGRNWHPTKHLAVARSLRSRPGLAHLR
jgi:hypothetical protein